MPVPFEPTPPQHGGLTNNVGGLRSQTAGGTTAWQYRPPERDLVAGRMALMRRQNDPYMQQSKQGAMELANARGQINSDYAAGAAQRAAIDAALPIASQDSDTLTKVGLANSEGERRLIEIQMEKDAMAAAANAHSGPAYNPADDERRYAHDLQMQRERLAFEGEQGGLGRGHDYGMGLMGIEGDLFGAQMGYGHESDMANQNYGYDLGRMGAQHGYNRDLADQGYGFDLGRMGAEYGYNRGLADQGYGHDLGRMGAEFGYNTRLADQGYGHNLGLAEQGYGHNLGLADQDFRNSRILNRDQYGYNRGLSELEARLGLESDYYNNRWGMDRDTNASRNNIYADMIARGMGNAEFMADPEAFMGFMQTILGSNFDTIFGGSSGGGRGRGR